MNWLLWHNWSKLFVLIIGYSLTLYGTYLSIVLGKKMRDLTEIEKDDEEEYIIRRNSLQTEYNYRIFLYSSLGILCIFYAAIASNVIDIILYYNSRSNRITHR